MADLLIIDDDLDAAGGLAELLGSRGHTVRVAYDGEEGLRAMRDRLPDAVILDVEMPVLDGPTTAYQMLVRDAGLEAIPILLVSGVANLAEVAAGVGTPYVLGKPYRVSQILDLAERALAERQAPRRVRRPDWLTANRLRSGRGH